MAASPVPQWFLRRHLWVRGGEGGDSSELITPPAELLVGIAVKPISLVRPFDLLLHHRFKCRSAFSKMPKFVDASDNDAVHASAAHTCGGIYLAWSAVLCVQPQCFWRVRGRRRTRRGSGNILVRCSPRAACPRLGFRTTTPVPDSASAAFVLTKRRSAARTADRLSSDRLRSRC